MRAGERVPERECGTDDSPARLTHVDRLKDHHHGPNLPLGERVYGAASGESDISDYSQPSCRPAD
jgi:hypothetical protein